MAEPSYDEVPYEGRAIPASAPAALVMTARAHGGPRGPLERARVLELGCGDGANLLPLAFHHPDFTLTGVDSSARAIGVAEESARALGLSNVRFTCADIAAFAPEGEHDYVIAHGLYSWIDADRREALRRIVRGALAPGGLAYVSFNAQPAWGVRGRVRDVLVRGPGSDLASARRRTAALLELLGEPQNDWAALLSHELERAAQAPDAYLAHEYLAEDNDAFWLGEVVRDFERAGLRYVGDATFDRPEGFVHPELRERALEGDTKGAAPASRYVVPLSIAEEERIDLLCYRQLRAAVFARGDAVFEAPAGIELLDEVRVASVVRALGDPFDPSPGVEELFAGPRGTEARVAGALSKMALLVLARDYPKAYSLSELSAIAAGLLSRQGITPEPDAREKLRAGLFALARLIEVELRLEAPRLRTTPGERPIATALTRHEAASRPALTTALHSALPIEPVDRAIIARLDGARSRSEVAAELARAVASGELALEGAPSGAARLAPLLEARVEQTITTLGWWGLVV